MKSNLKSKNKFTGNNSIVSRLFSVINGFIPVILVQRVTNLVNKVALLLHKYRFSQDCRNASGNDGCWGRELNVCYQFFNRMYHPGCSVNELPLKAKDDYKNVLQLGRSMIEMLGVLAIIAVLSVGGIAGYSKAMTKYKVNKTIEEYNFMITELLTYRDNLIKNNNERPLYLARIVKDLNFVPQTWQIFSNSHITDTLGNRVAPYISTENDFVMDINIFSNDKKASDYSNKLCIALIKDVAQNMYGSIKTISPQNTIHSSGGRTAPHFTTECQNLKDNTYKCLKDVTMPEIAASCQECLRNTSICNFVFVFNK